MRNRPAGSRNEADLHGEGQAWTPEMRAGVGGGVLALWNVVSSVVCSCAVR
ncbi:hypothetical protein EC178900_5146 [Escherichia coli 178900]|nr:hypothetical protein EC178900_5146 [Escherichia coli 178900]